jgi:hypothetical protein
VADSVGVSDGGGKVGELVAVASIVGDGVGV